MTGIKYLQRARPILPLVIFRVAFGLLMFASTIRFMAKGWIDEFYYQPSFHFSYYGFHWLGPLPYPWLYVVFGFLAFLALCIALGFFYRPSMIAFFLLFTYTELLDKTYYLNHYYFISVLSFLMIFLPAGRNLSIDSWLCPALKRKEVPLWVIASLRLQVGLVYFFAGVAKLKPDWLFEAMPLKIWLAGHSDFPLMGFLFDYTWFAYLMSWSGALYDLGIAFFLLYRPTRRWAYLAVIAFHLMTGLLFQIGMFPYIMIAATLIFFSADEFSGMARFFGFKNINFGTKTDDASQFSQPIPQKGLILFAPVLIVFFALQLLLPLRHWLYPGDVLWTEEGYRFAWHVMLAEKTGAANYYITDKASGRQWLLSPGDYLSPQQEKQMAFQPDMILEFAHYLEEDLAQQGLADVAIQAEVFVSLNGRRSRLLIDPTIDLTEEKMGLSHKDWILLE